MLCIWENALLLAILHGWKGATGITSQEGEEKGHMEGAWALGSLSSAPAVALVPALMPLKINPFSKAECYGHFYFLLTHLLLILK